MAQLQGLRLDPNVPENAGAFQIIPPGKYKAVIVADELKLTSTGGQMIELKLQIIEGDYIGVEIIDRLQIINASIKAQEIGQGTLKRICNLCKVQYPPPDTSKLFGVPMVITVKIEEFVSKTTGATLQSNKITGYNPASTVISSQTTKPDVKKPSPGGEW